MSLTDAQWARIEPLLPDRTPKRGGRWRGHQQVIDAIGFEYRTGTPWMDLPEHFGSWKGAHNRLRKWDADGTWEKVFTALLAQADAEGDLDWGAAVDSTIVRAHQHAAGARQKGPRPVRRAIERDDWTDYRDLITAAHNRLGGPIVLIWDDLNTHLTADMEKFIAAQDWLTVYQLPSYAPDLNPVEGIWSLLRRGFLANVAFADPDHLVRTVTRGLRKIQCRPQLIDGCLAATGLTNVLP